MIIPTFAEGAVLRQTVDRLLRVDGVDAIVVVDDGSTDYQQVSGLSPRITCLRHAINLGQGAALQTGIDFALQEGAEIIVTFDADGQMDEAEIARFRDPILRKEVQVVLGSRFVQGASIRCIPNTRKLALQIAVRLTRFMSGLPVTDTHNGFRAFSRDAAIKIRIHQNRMAHASEILHQIRDHGLTFQEVPVTISYTEHSLRKGQRLHNAFNILWDLLL